MREAGNNEMRSEKSYSSTERCTPSSETRFPTRVRKRASEGWKDDFYCWIELNGMEWNGWVELDGMELHERGWIAIGKR